MIKLWCQNLKPLIITQQNSYSISHLLGIVTTQWLHSDGVVTVLLSVSNSDYTVTVPSRWLMEKEFCCVDESYPFYDQSLK